MRAAMLSVLVACSSPSARISDAPRGTDASLIDAPTIDGSVADGQGLDAAALADAPAPDAHVVDAASPDAATGTIVHVTGIVDGAAGAHVTNLADGSVAIADASGTFAFDVASGSRLIMRATTTDATQLPMLRGVNAQAAMRTRHFNLETTGNLAAMSALGVTFDPSKAIVQIDFRHAQGGGYGARLVQAGATVVPGFGVADSGGDFVLATVTQTAFVTTLLLANLPPGDTHVVPIAPSFATLPCQRRDADPLPLAANTVTWVDFECGTDTAP